jgi:Plasmid pRiA4b ORF-3-like protein
MAKIPKRQRAKNAGRACQFLIILPNTDPLVWRRIQVPESYSFWDLHVAIQDAMGWRDYHLHEFVVMDPKSERATRIGIPDDEMPEERPCLAGWKVPITRYLTQGADPVRYRYDFGDDWEHTLEFEDVVPTDGGAYPRCVAGASACPPEDVGGTHGYAEFLRAIRDARHPEHEAMLQWAGGRFDPDTFRPQAITFDNPRQRWKSAFEDRGSAV